MPNGFPRKEETENFTHNFIFIWVYDYIVCSRIKAITERRQLVFSPILNTVLPVALKLLLAVVSFEIIRRSKDIFGKY